MSSSNKTLTVVPHVARLLGQDFSKRWTLAPDQRFFEEDWDLPRVERFSIRTKLAGQAAADLVFRLTNAPPEALPRAEAKLAARYRGPSASIGDIVEVDGEQFLCAGSGWMVRDQQPVPIVPPPLRSIASAPRSTP